MKYELEVNEGYECLVDVLQKSLNQAQAGKGIQRHVSAHTNFENQKIMQGARACGLGGMSYQVYKKATEAQRQAEEGDYNGAYSNLKGVIVYAAAQFLRTKEMEVENYKSPNPEKHLYFKKTDAETVECELCRNVFTGVEVSYGIETHTGVKCLSCVIHGMT